MLEDKARARGQARRRALLQGAAKLFKDKGYQATSLSDLIKEAGGSRASLYDYFGGKEGLLRAMLEEHTERILFDLSALKPDPEKTSPEEALNRLGLRFACGLMDDDAMAVLRILVTEAERLPDVADFFLRRGPDSVTARTAEYLSQLSEAGKLDLDDPLGAARCFIGAVIGDMLLRRLIAPQISMTREEIERHVNNSVGLFLRGIRPR